ncbi:MAG TPA: hypothetical protein VJB92_02215 [Candidatus Paceibacterota bacterium]
MEKEIHWSAPEFHYYEKDAAWYWLVIIGAIVLVGLALWQKNFLFAVFIIIAAILAITWGRKEPPMVDFILSEKGLDIGGKKFYSFESLEGFAIIPVRTNEELNELLLKSKNRLSGWIRIIIAAQRADAIKALFRKRLPEVEYQETLTEHISRWLKF